MCETVWISFNRLTDAGFRHPVPVPSEHQRTTRFLTSALPGPFPSTYTCPVHLGSYSEIPHTGSTDVDSTWCCQGARLHASCTAAGLISPSYVLLQALSTTCVHFLNQCHTLPIPSTTLSLNFKRNVCTVHPNMDSTRTAWHYKLPPRVHTFFSCIFCVYYWIALHARGRALAAMRQSATA